MRVKVKVRDMKIIIAAVLVATLGATVAACSASPESPAKLTPSVTQRVTQAPATTTSVPTSGGSVTGTTPWTDEQLVTALNAVPGSPGTAAISTLPAVLNLLCPLVDKTNLPKAWQLDVDVVKRSGRCVNGVGTAWQ